MKQGTSLPAVVLASLLLAGCFAPAGSTDREPIPTFEGGGHDLFVGPIYDHRTVVLGTPLRPLGLEGGTDVAVQPTGASDVRIPAGEVRSHLAHVLAESGLFGSVKAPPLPLVGSTRAAMIARAQEASDYLMVGEITQFNVRSIGANDWLFLTGPLDLAALPATLLTFVLTAGKSPLFTGGLFPAFSARATISLNISIIDVDTGIVLTTVRSDRHARNTYTTGDVYGAVWDSSDDWIDYGRLLGEVAVRNAATEVTRLLPQRLPGLLAED